MTQEQAQPTIYTTATDVDHFISPPKRRVGSLTLITNSAGAVLMCEKDPAPELRKPWYHPGGCVESNESRHAGLVRTARAKLGITVTPGPLLVIHQMFEKPHETHVSLEGLNFVYDGGTLPADTKFTFGAGVIGVRWFMPDELEEHLAPFTAWRTRAALRARETGVVEELEGHPAVA